MAMRIIFHCDCNAYFASVETLLRPELKLIPMAVAGNPENRHGIILAKNELAKKAGVVTAETINEAKRKCPDLVCVSPHHQLYRKYSQKINQIYLQYTEFVEPFSIDESYLDLTDSWRFFGETPRSLADMIRGRIRREIGITISVGVSYNKVLAKLASDLKKPDATTVIMPQDLEKSVWPLDISRMLYVGRVTAEKLRELNIQTIGDIARMNPDFLRQHFGKQGLAMSRYARGEDQSPVPRFTELEEAKSIGSSSTFSEDLRTFSEILSGIRPLAEEVGERLQKAGKVAFVIQVQIKYFNFQLNSKQITVPDPVQNEFEIYHLAKQLLSELWDHETPVRLLGISANNLQDKASAYTQISLTDYSKVAAQEKSEFRKKQKLESLIQKINQNVGTENLRLGAVNQNKDKSESGPTT